MASHPVSFAIPRSMAARDVAEVLNGYLRGAAPRDTAHYGPFQQASKWQLDASNDYWMAESGDQTVELRCRYDGQQNVVEAMAALFRARFLYAHPTG